MKQTSIIESYLDGTMNPEDRAEFVRQMAEDHDLAHEVKLHEEVNEAILENDVHYFRESIRNILNRKQPLSKKSIKLSWVKYPIVAGIAVLIGISLWNIVFVKSAPELYGAYYQPYNADLVTRDIKKLKPGSPDQGITLYQQGAYEDAYRILKNSIDEQPANKTVRFYYGMSCLELGYYDQSVNALKAVEEDPSTPFSLHARWYLAMLYLKTNQKELAGKYLTLLTASDNMYHQQASELLRKF